jgi:Phage tail assembly chaperone proteins, E, or 41 or 14
MNKPVREGFVTEEARPVELAATDPAAAAAAPPADPPPPQEVWPVKIKLLHKPVMNNRGELVRELEFRQPTGGDINRYGMPVRFLNDGSAVIEEKKMSMMMASLAGVLLPAMDQIDARDWMACAMKVQVFFIPDLEAAWS